MLSKLTLSFVTTILILNFLNCDLSFWMVVIIVTNSLQGEVRLTLRRMDPHRELLGVQRLFEFTEERVHCVKSELQFALMANCRHPVRDGVSGERYDGIVAIRMPQKAFHIFQKRTLPAVGVINVEACRQKVVQEVPHSGS